MLRKGLLRIAYNLSGFILFLGGLSFLDERWYFTLIGLTLTLFGMAILVISFWVLYIGKDFKVHHPSILGLSTLGIAIISLYELIKGRWELSIIIVLIGTFIGVCWYISNRKSRLLPKS